MISLSPPRQLTASRRRELRGMDSNHRHPGSEPGVAAAELPRKVWAARAAEALQPLCEPPQLTAAGSIRKPDALADRVLCNQ